MADNIRTKDELLQIFADANPALVTKQDLRDFVVSNLVVRRQIETSPQAVNAETDFFIADTGCNATTLPTIASYGDRSLIVTNTSGTALTVSGDGAETIEGLASVVIDDQVALVLAAPVTGGDWLILLRTVAQAPTLPSNDYAIAFIEASVALTTIIDGTFVDINDSLAAGLNSADLTVSASDITYVGTEAKIFAVDVSLSAEKVGGGHEDYSYAVAVNGSPLSPIAQDTVDNKFDSLSIAGIIALSTNDTVKVQVRGDGNTDDLNVKDLTLRLTEIRQ